MRSVAQRMRIRSFRWQNQRSRLHWHRHSSTVGVLSDGDARLVPVPSTSATLQSDAQNDTALTSLGRQELVFLLEQLSRTGVRDRSIWSVYAARALAEARSCSLEELCTMISALRRVGFAKRALLNIASRRFRSEAHNMPPRMLAQAVSDLRKLGHLDGPLLLALVGGVESRMHELSAFDLPLLLCAFARASVRDEKRITAVGQILQERRAQLEPCSVTMALYAFAMLDCDGNGAALALARKAGRSLTDSTRSELVNIAFALVTLDLPAAELLSYILERLARESKQLQPREAHALRIVEHCIRFQDALRPAMRASFISDAAALPRCEDALAHIGEATDELAIPSEVTSSKLQRRLERFFKRLNMPFRSEGEVGPYTLDYVLPQRVAVEVDGYKHFYAFSRRLTAKSMLKMRVLKAMGWRVVSLPHFQWLPRKDDERLEYLASQIEHVSGAPLAQVRRLDRADAGAFAEGPSDETPGQGDAASGQEEFVVPKRRQRLPRYSPPPRISRSRGARI